MFTNFSIFKILIYIFTLFVFPKLPYNKSLNNNNSLEKYFSFIICKLIFYKTEYICYNDIFNNYNFFDDIIENNQNIDLFLNIKKTKIEFIFLLIGIFPFLKNNSKLYLIINDKDIYYLLKYIFNKKIRKYIIIEKSDFVFFNKKLDSIINYKWELIPSQNVCLFIRYIINNYYNETFLDSFEKSLNLNLNYYIENKKGELSHSQLKELLCKFITNLFVME